MNKTLKTDRLPRPVSSPRREELRNSLIDRLPPAVARFGLRMLLSMIPVLIHRAATRSPRLRELLAGDPFVIGVTSLQGGGGELQLRDGRLRFRAGGPGGADLTQTWSSPNEALRALTSGDETDLMRAFVAGHLKMRGSFLPIFWLNEAMKLAQRRDSKQITQFLSREAA